MRVQPALVLHGHAVGYGRQQDRAQAAAALQRGRKGSEITQYQPDKPAQRVKLTSNGNADKSPKLWDWNV